MESKYCQSCGRIFNNRKKWKENFDQVKYCSKRCQNQKAPKKIMQKILEILEHRGIDKSICTSEILHNDDKKNQRKIEQVKSAARLLSLENKIEITQKNKVVALNFKGPIRLKLKGKKSQ